MYHFINLILSQRDFIRIEMELFNQEIVADFLHFFIDLQMRYWKSYIVFFFNWLGHLFHEILQLVIDLFIGRLDVEVEKTEEIAPLFFNEGFQHQPVQLDGLPALA